MNVISLRGLTVDLDSFSVLRNGEEVKLTAKEFHILKLFVSSPGRVFTKAQIYALVWEDEYYGDENVINVHMRRLREKIEDDPSHPEYIKTLWGIGYKLGDTLQ
ncbi:Transcriptional regulatory protein WalR [compost metagenome]